MSINNPLYHIEENLEENYEEENLEDNVKNVNSDVNSKNKYCPEIEPIEMNFKHSDAKDNKSTPKISPRLIDKIEKIDQSIRSTNNHFKSKTINDNNNINLINANQNYSKKYQLEDTQNNFSFNDRNNNHNYQDLIEEDLVDASEQHTQHYHLQASTYKEKVNLELSPRTRTRNEESSSNYDSLVNRDNQQTTDSSDPLTNLKTLKTQSFSHPLNSIKKDNKCKFKPKKVNANDKTELNSDFKILKSSIEDRQMLHKSSTVIPQASTDLNDELKTSDANTHPDVRLNHVLPEPSHKPASLFNRKSLKETGEAAVRVVNQAIVIPSFFSLVMKNVFWNEKNYSVNMSTTISFRICIVNLWNIISEQIHHLDTSEIVNKMDIIREILHLTFRINHVHVTSPDPSSMDPIKPCRFPKTDREHKIRNQDSQVVAMDLLDDDVQERQGAEEEGYAVTIRHLFENILLNMEEDLSLYPYDFTDMHLGLEVLGKHVLVKTKNGRTISMAVTYQLHGSYLFRNVFAVKDFDNNDQLDTHDTFKNYLGYRFFFSYSNKLHFMVSLRRCPEYAFKYALLPILLLQLFSITICNYGEEDAKLANLLAIFIAYGAFAIISASDTIQTKHNTIIDTTYKTSIWVSTLQFFGIFIDNAWYDKAFYEEQCFNQSINRLFRNDYTCLVDNVVFLVSICAFFYNLSKWILFYWLYVQKSIVASLSHDSITSDRVYYDLGVENGSVADLVSMQNFFFVLEMLFLKSKYYTTNGLMTKFFEKYDILYQFKKQNSNVIILDDWYRLEKSDYTDIASNSIANVYEHGLNLNYFQACSRQELTVGTFNILATTLSCNPYEFENMYHNDMKVQILFDLADLIFNPVHLENPATTPLKMGDVFKGGQVLTDHLVERMHKAYTSKGVDAGLLNSDDLLDMPVSQFVYMFEKSNPQLGIFSWALSRVDISWAELTDAEGKPFKKFYDENDVDEAQNIFEALQTADPKFIPYVLVDFVYRTVLKLWVDFVLLKKDMEQESKFRNHYVNSLLNNMQLKYLNHRIERNISLSDPNRHANSRRPKVVYCADDYLLNNLLNYLVQNPPSDIYQFNYSRTQTTELSKRFKEYNTVNTAEYKVKMLLNNVKKHDITVLCLLEVTQDIYSCLVDEIRGSWYRVQPDLMYFNTGNTLNSVVLYDSRFCADWKLVYEFSSKSKIYRMDCNGREILLTMCHLHASDKAKRLGELDLLLKKLPHTKVDDKGNPLRMTIICGDFNEDMGREFEVITRLEDKGFIVDPERLRECTVNKTRSALQYQVNKMRKQDISLKDMVLCKESIISSDSYFIKDLPISDHHLVYATVNLGDFESSNYSKK